MQIFLLGKLQHGAFHKQVHTSLADNLLLSGVLTEKQIEDDTHDRHETKHKNPCHGLLWLLVVHENRHDTSYRNR